MGFNHEYPYTDFHEINLDWILHQIMALHKNWDEFKAANKISNAGAWDITKQYQSWAIVSHDNKGYISLKAVPAGISIDNTEYWGLIADYDVFISDLADRIAALEQSVSGLSETVEDHTELIVNSNSRGTIVLFGDSWFANNNTMPTYIARHFGCNIKNYSYGGTGFNVPHGYKDQLEVMANDPTLDLDDVRFCIIMCGLNDHSINPPPRRSFTADEFIQAFNEWKAIYNTKFAGHVLPSVYWFHNYSLENLTTYDEEVVNPTTYWPQFIYYRTIRRGIREIKSCNCFGFVEGDADHWQTANWRHLNNAGYTQYAENMCKVIDGAPPTIYNYESLTGMLGAEFTIRSVLTKYKIEGDELYCEFGIGMKDIPNIVGGASITYDKYLPAGPESYYVTAGLKVSTYTYESKQIRLTDASATVANSFNATGRAFGRVIAPT